MGEWSVSGDPKCCNDYDNTAGAINGLLQMQRNGIVTDFGGLASISKSEILLCLVITMSLKGFASNRLVFWSAFQFIQ